jgi:aryl-phospho-beta-D-glucosidase BglC (GH1 family)
MKRSLFLVICFFQGYFLAQVPPLSTRGSHLIDANESVFSMRGVNWWGANGSQYPYSEFHSKGINTHAMPFGIHLQHIDTIMAAIKSAGFNTLRLPFSNQMLHDTTRAKKEWVGPNTFLLNKTPLEVLDEVITRLSDAGICVLLNNHSTTTHWCCNFDYNGLWFGKNKYYDQTTKQWINDWKFLANRYKSNLWVIGADLRNEVRPQRTPYFLPKNANWGRKNKKDWHRAATQAGDAIHALNPNWLIVVEGINARVNPFMQLSFPHLKSVRKKPVILKIPNKLVYEVHNYSFSWTKANILRMKKSTTYNDLSTEQRMKYYEQNWGYITKMEGSATPVIVGEFGCSVNDKHAEEWLRDLTLYMSQNSIGSCWWTLEEEIAEPSSYGILNDTLNEINVFKDWRGTHLQKYWKP